MLPREDARGEGQVEKRAKLGGEESSYLIPVTHPG